MRASLRVVFLLVAFAAVTVASPAFAANAQLELAAKKALKNAESDYLAMGYAAGAARLKKAAAACGASGCEPRTKAALVCDLATMLFRKGDKAGAVKGWRIAVKLKPDIALNPAYDQPDVSAAFFAATGGTPPRAAAQSGSTKGVAETKQAAASPESTRTESTNETETEGEGKSKGSGETGEGEGEGGNGPKKREEKHAASEAGPIRRFWLGASFGMEFMVMPSGKDVCHLNPAPTGPDAAMPTDPNNLYCTALNGADFPPRTPDGYTQNQNLVPGESGQSSGGLQRANARILLTADYAITNNLLLGARGGVALFTYPGQAAIANGRASSFGRLHLEARATWVFGENPFGSDGVEPLLFVGGGISEFDASTASSATVMNGAATVTGGVNIWKTDGPGFVTGGGGVRWAPLAELGVTLAARANVAFGNGAVVTFGPEIGVAYGF